MTRTWTWRSATDVMTRETRKRLLEHVYAGATLPLPLLERLCDLEDQEEDNDTQV